MKESSEKGNNNQLDARLRSLSHMRSACRANNHQEQSQQREQLQRSESIRQQSNSVLVQAGDCKSDILGCSSSNTASLCKHSTNAAVTTVTEEERNQMILEILLSAIEIIDR
jgi:hypothetical protein